jgi:hypothetical protein
MSIGDYSNPSWTNGEVINATKLQNITDKLYELDQYLSSNITYIKKASDETVNNSASVQDDNDFNITLDANCIYEIEVNAGVITEATADFKSVWTKGAGVTVHKRTVRSSGWSSATDNLNDTFANASTTYNAEIVSGCATGSAYVLNEKLLLETGASGNTLTFRWSQNSATVYNTKIEAGSWLIAKKLTAL